MAVGVGYLAKIKRAVRTVSTASDISTELTDLIEECRADLIRLGVLSTKANDETDTLILGAVRSFVRWKFAQDEKEAIWNMQDYMVQRDELRRNRDYVYVAITFTVKTSGAVAIPDALITFNGESKYTDSTGTAIFYYVSAGQNQLYTVSADGYSGSSAYLDVSASATVTVTL